MKQREAEMRKQAAYAEGEIAARNKLMANLADPRKVFGQGVKDGAGWTTKKEVAAPSVMQLLEHGFVHSDDMSAKPVAGAPPTKVVNAKTAAILARYGFAPGSNFGDTQHFDYIEGFTNAIPHWRERAKERTTVGPLGNQPAK